MKRILLLSDRYKDPGSGAGFQLCSRLRAEGARVDFSATDNDELERLAAAAEKGETRFRADDFDLLIVMGGDGSFLRAAHLALHLERPLLGVNLGQVGFMLPSNLDETLGEASRIAREDLPEERRLILQIDVHSPEGSLRFSSSALNDCVLSGGGRSRFLSLRLGTDGEWIEEIHGDGVILATPSGSTAYALAAGGPVLDPRLRAIELSPICPHTLQQRSYVFTADTEVSLAICPGREARQQAELIVDGCSTYLLQKEEVVRVRAAAETLRFVSLRKILPFRQIAEKLRRRF